MAVFPYQYSNINGIPSLEVRRIIVSDTSVDFVFRPDWDRNPTRGILFIHVPEAIPEGTTTTLPIRFSMAGSSRNVTVAGGANLTVADFAGTGYYIVAYDRNAGALQLIG